MCLIWGVTWVPINIGVAEVPPLLFAGSRLFFAGVLTVIWCAWRGEIRFDRPVRLALVAFLTVTATYGPIFWGARFVSSGLGSVLNSSLTPVTLLVLSVAAGQERFSRRQAAAMLLGLVGLAILFRPSALGGASALLGAGAIALGTVAYCAGSVLARPLMRTFSPAWMLGATGFGGGATLVILSLLLEHHPHGVSFSAATWASWWFC